MRAPLSCLFSLLAVMAAPAFAGCEGQNLLTLMPASESAALRDRAAEAPFSHGNFWTATRDGAQVTLIGTYHLGDPRHDAPLAALSPLIEQAATVLVEAGPAEEQQLIDRMAKDPSVMVMSDSTLPELLTGEEWDHLAQALKTRGVPAFMAAKFQPWYISLLLAAPACTLAGTPDLHGLDARIMDIATAASVPIRALEPYDTVFRIFDRLPLADQIEMIRSSLAMEDRAEDFATTLADSYFAGETRVIWELMRVENLRLPGNSPEKVEADMAIMEEALMTFRNQGWVPVIEEAASRGPVVAAFGALHLSGEDGVANLLARNGWTLTPLALP